MGLRNALRTICAQVRVDGIIAPAAIYEAGQQNVTLLNRKLHDVAIEVGSDLTIPVYATVILGRSVTNSDATLAVALAVFRI
jgi:hypothetical protein